MTNEEFRVLWDALTDDQQEEVRQYAQYVLWKNEQEKEEDA